MGLGLTGKLGRAWVVHGVGAWYVHGCMGAWWWWLMWCGDVVMGVG